MATNLSTTSHWLLSNTSSSQLLYNTSSSPLLSNTSSNPLLSNTSSNPLLSTTSSNPRVATTSPNLSAQIGISILTLAFVLGFPGNLFVVWSVWCRVKKRSVTCLLVLNLAAADAFVLLGAPFFLRYLVIARSRGWEFGVATCKLVHYLSSVNMYVSIYLITLMSADRWLAVTQPFLSQKMRTKRSLLVVLLLVWLVAFILSLPMLFYYSLRTLPHVPLSFCMAYHWGSVGHQVFQYLLETAMACLAPFSLISVCYASVMCRLRSAMFQQKGRGNRLILLIVGSFALFWLPYHVVNVMQVIGLLKDSEWIRKAAETARPNVTAFAYFSSAVNPILYVFAGSAHIRQAGLSFMGKLFEATNSESRTWSRGTRSSRAGSTPDEGTAAAAPTGLRLLAVKMGRPFEGGRTEGREAKTAAELQTLASAEPSE